MATFLKPNQNLSQTQPRVDLFEVMEDAYGNLIRKKIKIVLISESWFIMNALAQKLNLEEIDLSTDSEGQAPTPLEEGKTVDQANILFHRKGEIIYLLVQPTEITRTLIEKALKILNQIQGKTQEDEYLLLGSSLETQTTEKRSAATDRFLQAIVNNFS